MRYWLTNVASVMLGCLQLFMCIERMPRTLVEALALILGCEQPLMSGVCMPRRCTKAAFYSLFWQQNRYTCPACRYSAGLLRRCL